MRRLVSLLGIAMLVDGNSSGAQQGRPDALPSTIFVGTEAEGYLRTLQTLGMVPRHPWSARTFSPFELDRLAPLSAAHPWSTNPALIRSASKIAGVQLELAPTTVDIVYNTAFPFGMNDGAVWAGRGLTALVRIGASARWRGFSLVVAPTAFWAENRAFELIENGQTGARQYADGLLAEHVDRPQRFGDRPYARADAGQSTLRLEAYGAAVGFSTANHWWGPMTEFPYVLGNNAAGFPHVFLGTSSPRDLWVARVHGRVLYARLDQTPYSPVETGRKERFGSGVVLVVEPRLPAGLEFGFGRFFHLQWPDSGLRSRHFTEILQPFLKSRLGKLSRPIEGGPNQSTDNQIASVFGRWVLKKSGAELYAEYGREDHNWDGRDLILEPDHSASVGVGLGKTWADQGMLRTLHFEVINFQPSTLARHRPAGSTYDHTYTRQGHTHRGQLLASGFAVGGGAAAMLRLERVTSDRMSSWSLSRYLTKDASARLGGLQYAISWARFAPVTSTLGLRSALTAVYEFNRDLGSKDAFNVRIEIGFTPPKGLRGPHVADSVPELSLR